MLTVALVVAILTSSAIPAAVPAPHDDTAPDSVVSQIQTESNGVTIFGTRTDPGSSSSRPGQGDERLATPPDPTGTTINADDCRVGTDPTGVCFPAAPDDPGEPDVTLADVARFFAAQPTLTGDPVGYGLMNAPANIMTSAQEQTVTGELFDRPVQVRFVPLGYTFDYGDGATRTSDTGGATWEALGVPQFTPTATTHVYGERGNYTVSVTVTYAPFVNFGSGWRAVDGTVSATTSGYGIQIVEARTALVARDCLEDPSGVGCPTG